MFKKIMVVLLVLVLLVSASQFSLAESVQPRYSHISTMRAGIDLSGSSLWCFGQADCKYNDTTTRLYVRAIRQSHDGGAWARYASWSQTTSGFIPAIIEETITVDAGYDYQVYVLVQILDSNNTVVESDYMYSTIVSYPRT